MQVSAATARIYHFTHIDNLAAILAAGSLVSDSEASRSGLRTDVGDPGVKDRRRRRRVPCSPYGVVADYVPFYYAPRSPMMFKIACDHRDNISGRYAGGDDPLVYLVSSVDRVVAADSGWVATDGNCANAVTQFSQVLDDLEHLVDWPLMASDRWDDVPEDRDRMRRRMGTSGGGET